MTTRHLENPPVENGVRHLPRSQKFIVFENFLQQVEKKLCQQPVCEIVPKVQTDVFNFKSTKRYIETKLNCPIATFETTSYILKFIPDGNQSVELYWIETTKRGNGLGTDLINVILDISDEMNVKIKTIPADFDKYKDSDKIHGRGYLPELRDWYRSFGFKSTIISPCVFHYTPNSK